VHLHHKHTFGAVVDLHDLNYVVWSSSICYVGMVPVPHLREPGSKPHHYMHLLFLRITIRDTSINSAIPVIVISEGVAQLVKVLWVLC
jgi:hypothetical protein